MNQDSLVLHPVHLQTLPDIAHDPQPPIDGELLALDWADTHEKQLVIRLAAREGRQTMNLRTMPGAQLVVFRRPRGGIAGWAGLDVTTDPVRPEVFSQFVYPQFRGAGLGGLLEHVVWAHLDRQGIPTVYMRMEIDTNDTLFEKRLASGYCRQVFADELGARFLAACRRCELFGASCTRQAFLAVDVAKAHALCVRARGALDVSLPLQVEASGLAGAVA
jgi:GNAT superfamily N-acetyltransferase